MESSRDRQAGNRVWTGLLLLLLLVAGLALCSRTSGGRWHLGLVGAVSGDEPHYLVTVHSLLYDRDLDLSNNYAMARSGGPQAGRRFSGVNLDPHVILADHGSHRSLVWADYYDIDRPQRRPSDAHGFHFAVRRPNPLAPGSYVLMPSHPPAFGFLLTALLTPFQPGRKDVEWMAGLAVLALSLATVLLAYRTARAAELDRRSSFAATLLFALASFWLPYARTLFAEPAITLTLLLGLLAYLRGRMVPAALCVAAAIWVKPYFGLVVPCWMLERWLAGRRMQAFTLAAVAGVATLGLLAFNKSCAETFLVGGNAALAFNPHFLSRAWNHLLAPTYGLLIFTPWAVFAAFPPAIGPVEAGDRNIRRTLGWPILAQLLAFIILPIEGNGVVGCRYWVQFLPWLAILAVVAVRGRPGWTRAGLAALGVAGASVAVTQTLLYADTGSWMKSPLVLLRMLAGV